MIRACDGHRGHGEGGCGFSTSTWPGGECPMCGGEMVDRAPPAPPAPRRPVAGWVDLTVDESTILRYLIDAAASPYASDPLKDVYELGDKEPANPYAALKSLAEKLATLDAAAALGMRVVS